MVGKIWGVGWWEGGERGVSKTIRQCIPTTYFHATHIRHWAHPIFGILRRSRVIRQHGHTHTHNQGGASGERTHSGALRYVFSKLCPAGGEITVFFRLAFSGPPHSHTHRQIPAHPPKEQSATAIFLHAQEVMTFPRSEMNTNDATIHVDE